MDYGCYDFESDYDYEMDYYRERDSDIGYCYVCGASAGQHVQGCPEREEVDDEH